MIFRFDGASGRMAIGQTELHCGDCFQICIGGVWQDVRIELAGNATRGAWFLFGIPAPNRATVYEGHAARFFG